MGMATAVLPRIPRYYRGSGDKISENTAVVMGMGTKYYCYRGSGDNCIEFTAEAAVVGTDVKNRGSPRFYRGKMLLLFILVTKRPSLNTLFPFDTKPLILFKLNIKCLLIGCYFCPGFSYWANMTNYAKFVSWHLLICY